MTSIKNELHDKLKIEMRSVFDEIRGKAINWDDSDFQLEKAIICAKLSKLAYTAISDFEVED